MLSAISRWNKDVVCKHFYYFFLGIGFLCFFLCPITSQASISSAPKELLLKKLGPNLRFTLAGVYYSEDVKLEFKVIEPNQKTHTRVIQDNTVIDIIKSSIKIKHPPAGVYSIIIKNLSPVEVSFIGGVIVSDKHGLSQSHALNLDLALNESIVLPFSLKEGFIFPPPPNVDLLRWDPFDWL